MSDDDSVPRSYRLTLTGAGISIDQEIDQPTALAVVQVAMGQRPTPAAVIPSTGSASRAAGQRLSVREMLEDSGAKTIAEKVVVIGRFLRDQEDRATFSRDENKARFRTAGEPIPRNFPRDFQKAVRAGWVAEDHEKPGEFYITRRGDEVVNSGFAGKTSVSARPRRRRRASGSSENGGGHDD